MRKWFGVLAVCVAMNGCASGKGKVKPVAAAQPAAAEAAVVAPQTTAPIVDAQPAPGTNPTTICGNPITAPATLPPAGSSPVVFLIAPCWPTQGNQTVIEPATYLYYIQLKPSRPTEGVWMPYDEAAEKTSIEDFHRLWGTNFLDNVSVETRDYTFSNGVIGKMVLYNMEERQRIKFGPDFTGSKEIDTTKIDDKLKELNMEVRLDTFLDAGLVKKVSGIVTDMMKEKGFQNAEVTPVIQEVPGGPKLVHLTFNIDEGPKIKIQSIEFTGNKVVSSGTLKRQMKGNKERIIWARMFAGRSTYQENKFDEDAEKIVEYYRDRGYMTARVGAPELMVVRDSPDKKTRFVSLRIPVVEGNRYKVGEFGFDGNTVVKSDALRPMFKVEQGTYFSEKTIRKGLEKAREAYGAGGYYEFTGYPDYKFRDLPDPTEPDTPEALKAEPTKPATGPPVVDITVRLQEGKQFFVNRLTFTGNTTTRDSVIRREVRLVEDGVFNTEALKYSIKRLNQLGYFKPIEGGTKDVDVQKTPGEDNKVDVKLKLEEQNRNQLTFGAGVSQFEGFFGQASFSTSNFLGRGESLTLSAQSGSLAQNYSLAFTEPFLFDRNVTGGFNLFRRDIRYVNQFTQQSIGGVVTFGFPLAGFTRMFMNYSYEQVQVNQISSVYTDPLVLARNPYLADSLLIGEGGVRVISKVVPSLVHNTVDNPITPTTGRRYSLSIDLAGLGGNTNFYKPMVEGVWYFKENGRMSLGLRAQYQYIHAFSGSAELPIFEKLFLGGEYSVRGFDLRTIGPQDPNTGLVLGGNKSLLFNVEELITVAGPVRAVLFYDAGEVEPGPETLGPAPFTPLGAFYGSTVNPGKSFNFRDFKTSTGLEIRFFMPVLNVPFRLIFAYNPQRSGVLDNTLQPQSAFQFRFAVGSTF
jgi:outer membrane protein insertion porin family